MRLFVPEILFYRLPDNRPIEKKNSSHGKRYHGNLSDDF